MDESPSEIGARAEREVAYALERAGWTVYLPMFANHARIDLVACGGDEVVRVQCKTSRLKSGAICFRTCSNTRNVPKDYVGQIDAFGVYSPELERVFLVPIEGMPSRLCSLRLAPAVSGQVKGIRLADDYEVTRRR
jgi:hypothetical protein